MNVINYIVWGISDEGGYSESISSSYDNNILPSFIKKSNSTGDEVRRIALAYASDNPNQNYFYSIERVDDKALYTIYRTNWYRDNRISYDAVTLIINQNNILENAALSLKKVILQYVSLKESGIRAYDLSSIISSLKVNQKLSSQRRNIRSNSTHAYLIKNDSKAFKKYTNESELNKIFVDQKSSLLNFNKVFFITKLKYLEEGPQKLINIDEIHPQNVKLVNFDHNYHTLFIDDIKSTNLIGNVFSAFEGDKVEIRKNPGNKLEKSFIVNSNQSTIVLEKIKIKKQKPVHSKRKKSSWKTKENIFLLSSIIIMSLVSIFVVFDNQIIRYVKNISKEAPKTNLQEKNYTENNITKPNVKQDIVVFKDSCFFIGDEKINSAEKLQTSFWNFGIIVDNVNYFQKENKIYCLSENEKDTIEVNLDDLKLLNRKIETSKENINKDLSFFFINIINQKEDIEKEKNNQDIIEKKTKIKNDQQTIIEVKVNNKESEKIDIECSAKKQIKRFRNKYTGDDKKRLDNFFKKLERNNRRNADDNNKVLNEADNFIKAVENCNCEECNKFKEIAKYSELKKYVDFHINK